MTHSSIYIFRNEEDRKNFEMYKELADLVMRIDGEIYPDNLAVAKRPGNYYVSLFDTLESERKRKKEYDFRMKKIEQFLGYMEKKGADVSEYRALKDSDTSWYEQYKEFDISEIKEMAKKGKMVDKFGDEFERYLKKKDRKHYRSSEACLTICDYIRGYRPYFTTREGDIFLWVSGNYEMMSNYKLRQVARTPKEKELVANTMIGFTQNMSAGYWFDDLEEPELPSKAEKMEWLKQSRELSAS